MQVQTCDRRTILQPCRLEEYTYQIDPYIGCEHRCRYCYALNQAETDWAQEILIHQDIAGQLRQELSLLDPQPVYLGWNSDPYQPSEVIHRQTRQVLELLAQRGFTACILTKSDLVRRDVDLLASMPGSSAGISIAFHDEGIRQLFEPHAPPTARRVEALKALKEAGIRTYVLICPVMPFITDAEALIEMAAAHADMVCVYPLSMNAKEDRNWRNVRDILDLHFPELVEEYRVIAFSPDDPYWTAVRRRLEQIKRQKHLDLRIEPA